ncbi:MAG: ABC transporter permease [Opitutaceae bacterium]|nr:ABC transporter permease [Opitutaceae bacterium]
MRGRFIFSVLWPACLIVAALTGAAWLVGWLVKADPWLVSLCGGTALASFAAALLFGICDYGWGVFWPELTESLAISAAQVAANKLRSALTALGVIIGIVAVTLMGTAILGIDAGVERSLSGFGDDVLYVSKWPWRNVQDWWNFRNRRDIRIDYVEPVTAAIAERPEGPLKLAVPSVYWSANVIRGEYRVSNVSILGTSSELPYLVKSDMKEGRFFTEVEARGGRNVVVIGYDIADALFPNESPLDKTIRIRSQQYTVVGVAARQGSFLGMFSWDSVVIMPVDAFTRSFPIRWADPTIRVQVDMARLDEAKEELRSIMRRVRGLGPEQKDDFEINSQQVIRDQIDPIKANIAIGGFFITGLALFVGAIGIMNITSVSVKERTKEIGTRKALGARRRTILLQFLIEAVSICVLGGVGGLALAWGLSAAVGALLPSFPLVFSAALVVLGLAISVVTGVLSGFMPALQASKLDPVVALRYE